MVWIMPTVFSLVLIVPCVYYVCKGVKSKKEGIIAILLMTLYCGLWIGCFIGTIKSSYSLGIKFSRFIVTIINFSLLVFALSRKIFSGKKQV